MRESTAYDRRRLPGSTLRSRNAFAMTETELRLIAAAAIIGLSVIWNAGYKAPAATGTASTL